MCIYHTCDFEICVFELMEEMIFDFLICHCGDVYYVCFHLCWHGLGIGIVVCKHMKVKPLNKPLCRDQTKI